MKTKEYQKKLVHKIILSLEKHGCADILSSVILTGSLGRDEPTFVQDKKGKLILKSDVEIALVYQKNATKRNLIKLIQEVNSEFSEDLNLMLISQRRVKLAYSFNLTLLKPKYKTLFTYDLYNGSKTVWGEDYLMGININVNDIDPYEAKRIVGNRIGELIYLQANNNDGNIIQWKGKVILSVASAWLILQNKYTSSYHKQCEEICNLKDCIKYDLGNNFLGDYLEAFSYLRENGKEMSVSNIAIRNYVKRINAIFDLKGIHRPKVNSVSRIIKYLFKYIKVGMPFGINKFENKIIEKLILDYCNSDKEVEYVAKIWHEVLY